MSRNKDPRLYPSAVHPAGEILANKYQQHLQLFATESPGTAISSLLYVFPTIHEMHDMGVMRLPLFVPTLPVPVLPPAEPPSPAAEAPGAASASLQIHKNARRLGVNRGAWCLRIYSNILNSTSQVLFALLWSPREQAPAFPSMYLPGASSFSPVTVPSRTAPGADTVPAPAFPDPVPPMPELSGRPSCSVGLLDAWVAGTEPTGASAPAPVEPAADATKI